MNYSHVVICIWQLCLPWRSLSRPVTPICWSEAIVRYSFLIPDFKTLIRNTFLLSMAKVQLFAVKGVGSNLVVVWRPDFTKDRFLRLLGTGPSEPSKRRGCGIGSTTTTSAPSPPSPPQLHPLTRAQPHGGNKPAPVLAAIKLPSSSLVRFASGRGFIKREVADWRTGHLSAWEPGLCERAPR